MKKIFAALMALAIISCGNPKLDEGTVARVNEVNIPQEEFDKELDAFKKQYEAQGQFLTEADLASVKPRILDSLVVKQLLLEQAGELEIAADSAAVQEQITMFKQQFPSDEDFTASLASNGFTEESLIEELEWQSVLQTLFEKEVADKTVVADEDVKEFYDTNKDVYFTVPESVEASHILLMVNEEQSEERALERITFIKSELDKGLDFGDAASTFSEGPTRSQKGSLGTITRGQTVPPFEEAAFSQDIGVVGEPVLTQFGYHLILVTAKNEATVTPFEEVKEIIKQQISQQAYQEGTLAYIEGLREAAKIVLPEWATAEPSADEAAAPPVQS